MEALKNKEKATIKDIVTTFKSLDNRNKEKLILIGYGMSIADDGSKKVLNDTDKPLG